MGADKKNYIFFSLFLTDIELDVVANKEVDKVADMVAGYGCWLIGRPNLGPNFLNANLIRLA